MAGMAVKGSMAKTGMLALVSFFTLIASAKASTTTNEENIVQWLKITAVPLLVFLIGACIWGCFENTTAWRMLTEGGGGSARNDTSEAPADSSPHIADLEEGLELPQIYSTDDNRHVNED